MRNSQAEYNKILDSVNARAKGLSQSECENILIANGYTPGQAKNGAYVYLHHGKNLKTKICGTKEEYSKILDEIDAKNKQPKECIAYLESMGFSYRQAQSAVYNYRVERKLIGK